MKSKITIKNQNFNLTKQNDSTLDRPLLSKNEKNTKGNGLLCYKNNGITLIALVVTIVVLLILAGITINLLFSDTGLFGKAQEAENAWRNGENSDREAIGELANKVNELVNGTVQGETGTGEGETPPDEPETPIVPEDWDLSKVTPVPSLDETPVNVPVPKGFTASTLEAEQKVEEGFVIKQDGTNNEFVWIPVSEERLAQMYTTGTATLAGGTGVTTSIYSNLRYITGSTPGNTSGYREPDLLTDYDTNTSYYSSLGLGSTAQEFAQKMVDEYQEIHASIEQYGGFYIGRYELTGNDINNPTVVKGGTVITNQNWYNLKAACIKLVDNSGKQEGEITAKTTMIYGNQWDEICNWLSTKGYDINDSSDWGNYNSNRKETGSDPSYKANEIFDLAGNLFEWTQEACSSNYRIARGGVFMDSGSSFPVSDRRLSLPYNSDFINTSRAVLYIS